MTIQDAPPYRRYALTVDDYALLDQAGAFGHDRTQLIEGEVIVMDAQYRRHA